MITFSTLSACAQKFHLNKHFQISLQLSEEGTAFSEGAHTFYASYLSENNLIETMAKAKVNEIAGTDMFLPLLEGSDMAKAAFESLCMPLLMCWVYDTISLFATQEEMIDELEYLQSAYQQFCEQSEKPGAPSLAASAFTVLKIHGFTADGEEICLNHNQTEPLIHAAQFFANKKPSPDILVDYFNSLGVPVLARFDGTSFLFAS